MVKLNHGGDNVAISEKKAITDKRHHEKLDRIVIQPYKEHGGKIRQAAADAGQSLQGYILQAVDEKMDRDKKR
jgi:hypothetical protein